jgi:hypothetical protein
MDAYGTAAGMKDGRRRFANGAPVITAPIAYKAEPTAKRTNL